MTTDRGDIGEESGPLEANGASVVDESEMPSDSKPDEQSDRVGSRTERTFCEHCDEQTVHEVTVEMESTVKERTREEHEKFAKAPTRLAICQECGTEIHDRVTDPTTDPTGD